MVGSRHLDGLRQQCLPPPRSRRRSRRSTARMLTAYCARRSAVRARLKNSAPSASRRSAAAYIARCSARCVPAFMAPASSISAAARSVAALCTPASSSDGLVRVGRDLGGAHRGGPFVAGVVLQVGQRIGRLRAHRLVVRRLEMRDRLVQLVGGARPAIRALPSATCSPAAPNAANPSSQFPGGRVRRAGPARDAQLHAALLGAVIRAAHANARASPGVGRLTTCVDRAVARNAIFELACSRRRRSPSRAQSISCSRASTRYAPRCSVRVDDRRAYRAVRISSVEYSVTGSVSEPFVQRAGAQHTGNCDQARSARPRNPSEIDSEVIAHGHLKRIPRGGR